MKLLFGYMAVLAVVCFTAFVIHIETTKYTAPRAAECVCPGGNCSCEGECGCNSKRCTGGNGCTCAED